MMMMTMIIIIEPLVISIIINLLGIEQRIVVFYQHLDECELAFVDSTLFALEIVSTDYRDGQTDDRHDDSSFDTRKLARTFQQR